jgi:hypothetical protein
MKVVTSVLGRYTEPQLDKSLKPGYTKVVDPQYSVNRPGYRRNHRSITSIQQAKAPEGVMDTHYPHHHSQLHPPLPGQAMRPICVYCLHLLGTAEVPLNASTRRMIEDDHECVEKVTARQPHVALPFN